MIARQMSNKDDSPSVDLNEDLAQLSDEISPLKPRPNLRTVEAEERRLNAGDENSDRSHLSFGSVEDQTKKLANTPQINKSSVLKRPANRLIQLNSTMPKENEPNYRRKSTQFADTTPQPTRLSSIRKQNNNQLDGSKVGYQNPRERAKRTLSIRHGIIQRQKSTVMVVKGPAGGRSKVKPATSSPDKFFMRQGTIADLHKMSQHDAESRMHTDRSMDQYERTSTKTKFTTFTGDVNELNRQRSRRIQEKKIVQENKFMKKQLTLHREEDTKRSAVSRKSEKDAKQLLQEFSGFTAGRAVINVTKKPREFMTLNDLVVEKNYLQQKMKHINTYLTRLIAKETQKLKQDK